MNSSREAARPEVIVFDVGGVVVQWQPLVLMQRHFPRHARNEAQAREVLAQVSQSFEVDGDWAAFDCGRVDADELATRIARRTGLARDDVASLLAAIPNHLQPMAPSIALIDRLRTAGYRLGLLSNMPRSYADHLEREHGVFAAFEHCAWSGRLGVMKPQREIFDHVQASLGIADASRLLFIDDHPGNVEAARALGWQAVLFTAVDDVERALNGAY